MLALAPFSLRQWILGTSLEQYIRHFGGDRQCMSHTCPASVTSTVSQVASLPAGIILDRIGPTRASILGAALFGLGNAVFGGGRLYWPVGELPFCSRTVLGSQIKL